MKLQLALILTSILFITSCGCDLNDCSDSNTVTAKFQIYINDTNVPLDSTTLFVTDFRIINGITNERVSFFVDLSEEVFIMDMEHDTPYVLFITDQDVNVLSVLLEKVETDCCDEYLINEFQLNQNTICSSNCEVVRIDL